MIPRVVFHVAARRELEEAAHFYESESPGLGEEFLREIEHSIRSIAQHPDAGPIIGGTVRRRLARRFPYALLYSLKPSAVRILAVAHLKRRPLYWAGRE